MRVIAGKARSVPLYTVKGMDVRPTTDRIKETLFNMISGDLFDCIFLDLFSGSGGIGIEALSRGAREVFFVDRSRECISCIKKNLARTHLEEGAAVLARDWRGAIKRLESEGIVFDLIFMDPPYDSGFEFDVLEELGNSTVADDKTLIIIEASLRTDFSDLGSMGFELIKTKEYKTNQHAFVRKLRGTDIYENRNLSRQL